MKVSSQRLSIKTPSPTKSRGMGTSSSTDVYSQSLKNYSKAALREPLSFGSTALLQTPSLLGMSAKAPKTSMKSPLKAKKAK